MRTKHNIRLTLEQSRFISFIVDFSEIYSIGNGFGVALLLLNLQDPCIFCICIIVRWTMISNVFCYYSCIPFYPKAEITRKKSIVFLKQLIIKLV